MTDSEVLKAIKEEARAVGLTFKVDPKKQINGMRAYRFCVRRQRYVVLENMTLHNAYTHVLSGYINSWNKQTEHFEGVE